jgi:hypothetical protein
MKYEPKVDYRRKRGMVEEINRSLQAVEDDVNAANALGHRRWVEPGPIEYGPSQIEAPEDGHGDGTTQPQLEPRAKPPEPKGRPPEAKGKPPAARPGVKKSEAKQPDARKPAANPSEAKQASTATPAGKDAQ